MIQEVICKLLQKRRLADLAGAENDLGATLIRVQELIEEATVRGAPHRPGRRTAKTPIPPPGVELLHEGRDVVWNRHGSKHIVHMKRQIVNPGPHPQPRGTSGNYRRSVQLRSPGPSGSPGRLPAVDPEQLSLFEVEVADGRSPFRPGPDPSRSAAATLERVRERLAVHLADGGEALGRLTLTDNRSTVLSSRPGDGGGLDVRLHWSFTEAPDAVLAAVARVLAGPRRGAAYRQARKVVRAWTAEHRGDRGHGGPPAELAPAVVPSPRPAAPPDRTRGRVHDLEAIRDEVNRRYFGGRLRVAIAWARNGRPRAGRGRRRRATLKLGSWSPQDRTVRIHPVLDHESVPRPVVVSVVHHEMLHADLEPVEVVGGRRRLHTPEFRRRERQLDEYEEARHWIDRNLDALVRRRARSGER